MPSDHDRRELADHVLDLLAEPLDAFRSALVVTIEEVRAWLATRGAGGEPVEPVEAETAELGGFAAGRIDGARFSALVAREEPLDADATAHVERALATLRSLAARQRSPFCVDVPPGTDLRDAVDHALAEIGGALGAARAVDQTRASARRDERADLGARLPFRRWSRAERALAPPLVVSVDGADLRTGGLAELLDGRLKIVLVVRGAGPAAPLARLVSPGTYVVQTGDVAGLEGLARWDGPGIGAIVPDGAARFVHDPSGGDGWGARLRVEHLPESAPRKAVGGASVAQQAEDLAHLEALASIREADATGANAMGGATARAEAADDPAGRLAAWLLEQAERAAP